MFRRGEKSDVVEIESRLTSTVAPMQDGLEPTALPSPMISLRFGF